MTQRQLWGQVVAAKFFWLSFNLTHSPFQVAQPISGVVVVAKELCRTLKLHLICIHFELTFQGGYAQAICAKMPEPAAHSWTDVSASGSYWSNKDGVKGQVKLKLKTVSPSA